LYVIFDSKKSKVYNEGFSDCLKIFNNLINSEVKNLENALDALNNIILCTQHLQLIFNKGE